jgi:TolB protein
LPVSAGTASGVKPVPLGYDRVYVKLSGAFSYHEWFRALKAGRSFATNGPMLFLTVNGNEPGNSVVFPATRAKTAGRLKVHAEVTSLGDLERLEIIWKGKVVKAVEASSKTQHLNLDLEVDAQSSGWFAARAFEKPTETVRFAHTSPVYVQVGGSDGIVAEDAKYLLGLVEQQIRFCETSHFRSEADRQAMLAFFKKAAAVYTRLAVVR